MISFRSVLLLASAALTASANPVNWTLTSVTSLGTTITGSFVYDADTGTYSNIAISTSGGSLIPAKSWSQIAPQTEPLQSNNLSLVLVDSTGANLFGLLFGAGGLTDAGGAVAIYATLQERCTVSNCSAFDPYSTDPSNGVNYNATGYVASVSSTPAPLTVVTSSLPSATSGRSYNTTLMASGGSGGYTWSVSLGSLPIGFTLSPTGVVTSTGSPAAATNLYSFTVQVTDASNNIATRPLTLYVEAVQSLFVATIGNGTMTYTNTLTSQFGCFGSYDEGVINFPYELFPPVFPLTTTGNGQWIAASGSFSYSGAGATMQLSAAGVLTTNVGTYSYPSAGGSTTTVGNQATTLNLNTGAWQESSMVTFTNYQTCIPAQFTQAGTGQFRITLTPSTAPAFSPGGVVPLDSSVNTIAPGEWVSIYGTNLASGTVAWNGTFTTSLGGTSVTIDGKSAYLSYVSSTQIDLQAPDDLSTGPVPIVVKTANGTFNSTVTLAQFAPSFFLLDSKHVAGIIPRPNGSGAYGGGTYDILGPTGTSFGYATVAAKAGDTVELFGTGFGPTNPPVSAGQPFSSAAPTTSPVNLLINKVSLTPSFAGLSGAGLDQINLTVPAGLGTGDVPLAATVGGAQTQSGVVISLQ